MNEGGEVVQEAPQPGQEARKAKSSKTPAAAKRKAGKKVNGAKVVAKASAKKNDAKSARSYPNVPLEDALTVASAIRQKNNGHPWDTELIAKACGLSKKNPKFFYLAAAARDYGLTNGSRDTPKIELSELGRQITFAPSSTAEHEKKIEAFFTVEKFKQVYDHYSGSELPEEQYLTNTLEQDFQIPPDRHAEFVEVFKANLKYLGIEKGLGSVKHSGPNGTAPSMEFRHLGQPEGELNLTAFVIMPFSEKTEPAKRRGSSMRS